MHIKQIILDGFKSYAHRTVIDGFDERFNAITGLNGSGKSNILDSICFVLGITQLGQVRVSNLQGLVYKQGQAGVTKASVTIVFDNTDRKGSPVGYEQYDEITVTRQVVIGGRNKYLLNGHNAKAAQIQNLFHSVQLNVNNPHFLIMQGRITKVLNMKPPEILGMIEEAAGTRMYETKKLSAQKKIEQKQVKVDEIENVLKEEIQPKLDKLRGERAAYLKWANNNTEMERLARFCVAYEYTEKEEVLKSAGKGISEIEAEIARLGSEQETQKAESEDIKVKITELNEHKAKKVKAEYEKLTSKEEEASKVLVKATSAWENKSAAYEADVAAVESLATQGEDLKKQLEEKESKLNVAKEKTVECEAGLKAASEEVEAAQRKLQAANNGMSAGEDGEAETTLQEQLMAAQSRAAACKTEHKSAKMEKSHIEKKAKALKKRVSDSKKKGSKLIKEVEAKRKTVATMEEDLSSIEFDPAQFLADQERHAELESSLDEVRETYEDLSAKLAAFEFSYSKPSKKFDDSKVKGLVAKLIKVNDVSEATALEVVAGGRLFQVVVDSVATGKALLEKGKLKRRVTIVPLDKVAANTLPKTKISRAEKIAKNCGGTARVALSLVGYDKEVEAAMKYVFGTTLVCDTMATARSVTFDKGVRVRSVTLEGDSFDPSGTLSGGSRNNRGSVLVQLKKLADAQARVEELEAEFGEIDGRLKKSAKAESQHAKLSSKLDLARHELQLVEERASHTEHGQFAAELQVAEESIERLKETISRSAKEEKECKELCKTLEASIENLESERASLVEAAEKDVKAAKKAKQAADKKAKKSKQAEETLSMEIDQIKEDMEANASQIVEDKAALEKTKAKLEALESEVATRRDTYEAAKSGLDAVKASMEECDEELAALNKQLKIIAKQIKNADIDAKKLEGKAQREAKKLEGAGRAVDELLAANPWINEEKQFFGRPHTDYDFEERNPKKAQKRMAELESSNVELSKKINKKVMGMIEKAEKEYDELMKKKRIIEDDRYTIEKVIEGLDQKKNEALFSTYKKVNKDFGSIFSTLLTGSKAKLVPPEGGTVLDGLEVKVAFGDTWKESLTELSGGQRSLLALSLILSLLLFKPAPMYILDEVDAALDLSHTQNIGQMLKTHFGQSQFLVVSLKEGMFNNANVVFRTKFVDGVSTVSRTANNQGDENLLGGSNAAVSKKTKGKSKKRKVGKSSSSRAKA